MDLSNMIVHSKTVEIEYPEFEGFVVSVAYLTRDELTKIRKKCTVSKLKRNRSGIENEIDDEMFQDLYIKAVIKGWKGLTYEYLSKLVPVDLDSAEGEELEFSETNSVVLMRNSPEFDTWIAEVVSEVENFS